MLIAWIHGCIGLYFWLRMKAFYKHAAPYLLAAVVLLPSLTMLGLYQAGRVVVADSESAQWRRDNLAPSQVGTSAEQQVLERIVDYFLISYLGLIGFVVLARGARAIAERRGGMINLSYGNGRTVRVPKGLSVLEASLR
jgi:adenylate cyclase